MTDDDDGRLAARHRVGCDSGIVRRIEKRVRHAAAAARVADALRHRQVGGRRQVADRTGQHFQFAIRKIDAGQFQRNGRRAAQQRDKAGADAQFANLLVRVGDRFQRGAVQQQPGQLADAVVDIGANDLVVGTERIHRSAEGPVRAGEFGLHRTHRFGGAGAGVLAVQIPPAAAVGHKIQGAVGRPFRLANRFIGAAGDQARRTQVAIGLHLGQPQLGALPRHARVIPAEPSQRAAIRRQARRGVKIVALGQHRFGAIWPDRAKRVDRMRSAIGRVQFAHADQALALTVDDKIGVAPSAGGVHRQRIRRAALHVNPVVGKMREIHGIARHRISAAAIFVNPGADIEWQRRQFADAATALAQQGVAPRFTGTPGQPENIATVRATQRQLRQRRRAGGDQRGADRRRPDAIGGGFDG